MEINGNNEEIIKHQNDIIHTKDEMFDINKITINNMDNVILSQEDMINTQKEVIQEQTEVIQSNIDYIKVLENIVKVNEFR